MDVANSITFSNLRQNTPKGSDKKSMIMSKPTSKINTGIRRDLLEGKGAYDKDDPLQCNAICDTAALMNNKSLLKSGGKMEDDDEDEFDH